MQHNFFSYAKGENIRYEISVTHRYSYLYAEFISFYDLEVVFHVNVRTDYDKFRLGNLRLFRTNG